MSNLDEEFVIIYNDRDGTTNEVTAERTFPLLTRADEWNERVLSSRLVNVILRELSILGSSLGSLFATLSDVPCLQKLEFFHVMVLDPSGFQYLPRLLSSSPLLRDLVFSSVFPANQNDLDIMFEFEKYLSVSLSANPPLTHLSLQQTPITGDLLVEALRSNTNLRSVNLPRIHDDRRRLIQIQLRYNLSPRNAKGELERSLDILDLSKCDLTETLLTALLDSRQDIIRTHYYRFIDLRGNPQLLDIPISLGQLSSRDLEIISFDFATFTNEDAKVLLLSLAAILDANATQVFDLNAINVSDRTIEIVPFRLLKPVPYMINLQTCTSITRVPLALRELYSSTEVSQAHPETWIQFSFGRFNARKLALCLHRMSQPDIDLSNLDLSDREVSVLPFDRSAAWARSIDLSKNALQQIPLSLSDLDPNLIEQITIDPSQISDSETIGLRYIHECMSPIESKRVLAARSFIFYCRLARDVKEKILLNEMHMVLVGPTEARSMFMTTLRQVVPAQTRLTTRFSLPGYPLSFLLWSSLSDRASQLILQLLLFNSNIIFLLPIYLSTDSERNLKQQEIIEGILQQLHFRMRGARGNERCKTAVFLIVFGASSPELQEWALLLAQRYPFCFAPPIAVSGNPDEAEASQLLNAIAETTVRIDLLPQVPRILERVRDSFELMLNQRDQDTPTDPIIRWATFSAVLFQLEIEEHNHPQIAEYLEKTGSLILHRNIQPQAPPVAAVIYPPFLLQPLGQLLSYPTTTAGVYSNELLRAIWEQYSEPDRTTIQSILIQKDIFFPIARAVVVPSLLNSFTSRPASMILQMPAFTPTPCSSNSSQRGFEFGAQVLPPDLFPRLICRMSTKYSIVDFSRNSATAQTSDDTAYSSFQMQLNRTLAADQKWVSSVLVEIFPAPGHCLSLANLAILWRDIQSIAAELFSEFTMISPKILIPCPHDRHHPIFTYDKVLDEIVNGKKKLIPCYGHSLTPRELVPEIYFCHKHLLVNFADLIFDDGKFLDEGSFGSVFSCQLRDGISDKIYPVAVKVLKESSTAGLTSIDDLKHYVFEFHNDPERLRLTKENIDSFLKEINMLDIVSGSADIVNLIGISLSPLFFVMTYAEGGSLHQQLRSIRRLDEKFLRWIRTILSDRFRNNPAIPDIFQKLQSYHLRCPDSDRAKFYIAPVVTALSEVYSLPNDAPEIHAKLDTFNLLKSPCLDYLKTLRPSFTFMMKLKIWLDIARGMNAAHNLNIIHRDLKSPNVFLRSTLAELQELQQLSPPASLAMFHGRSIAIIGDFGTARLSQRQVVHPGCICVPITFDINPRWCAPEVDRIGFTCASDVFSFGMIGWELMTGDFPFDDVDMSLRISALVNSGERPELPQSHSPYISELNQLIDSCWHANPASRPAFSSIVTQLEVIAENFFNLPRPNPNPPSISAPKPVERLNPGSPSFTLYPAVRSSCCNPNSSEVLQSCSGCQRRCCGCCSRVLCARCLENPQTVPGSPLRRLNRGLPSCSRCQSDSPNSRVLCFGCFNTPYGRAIPDRIKCQTLCFVSESITWMSFKEGVVGVTFKPSLERSYVYNHPSDREFNAPVLCFDPSNNLVWGGSETGVLRVWHPIPRLRDEILSSFRLEGTFLSCSRGQDILLLCQLQESTLRLMQATQVTPGRGSTSLPSSPLVSVINIGPTEDRQGEELTFVDMSKQNGMPKTLILQTTHRTYFLKATPDSPSTLVQTWYEGLRRLLLLRLYPSSASEYSLDMLCQLQLSGSIRSIYPGPRNTVWVLIEERQSAFLHQVIFQNLFDYREITLLKILPFQLPPTGAHGLTQHLIKFTSSSTAWMTFLSPDYTYIYRLEPLLPMHDTPEGFAHLKVRRREQQQLVALLVPDFLRISELWTIDQQGELYIWDAHSYTAESSSKLVLHDRERVLSVVSICPENEIWFGTSEGRIHRWNWSRSANSTEFYSSPAHCSYSDAIRSIDRSPSGNQIWIVYDEGMLELWNREQFFPSNQNVASSSAIPSHQMNRSSVSSFQPSCTASSSPPSNSLDMDAKYSAQISIATELSLLESENLNSERILIENRIRDHGLQIPRPNPAIKADGNCQFSSLAYLLLHNAHRDAEIRQNVVGWLRRNPDFSFGDGSHNISNFLAERTIDQFCSEMERDRTWGDHLTLIAASQEYQKSIRIFSSIPGDEYITHIRYDDTEPLHLLHWAERHYEPLVIGALP